MADEKQMKQAQSAFQTLCEMLDEQNWHYEKDAENLMISLTTQGEDLHMNIKIAVAAERQIIMLFSQLPYTIAEDKRKTLAVAVSAANNALIDGNFDYDYLNGEIVFRMTSSFHGSLIGKEVFEYMLYFSCFTIDEYNDKFLIVAKSDMSYEEILEFVK